MSDTINKIIGILFFLFVLLPSGHMMVHAQVHEKTVSDPSVEKTDTTPDMADIIPLAGKLKVRLSTHENNMKRGPDTVAVENNLKKVEANLVDLAVLLQQLKDSKSYKYYRLVDIKETIKHENKLVDEISMPVQEALRQLEKWKNEWLADRLNWKEWQSSMLQVGAPDKLKAIFVQANATIDTALHLIPHKFEAMLVLQERAAFIQTKIGALTAQCEDLITIERSDALINGSPPMFSSRYFSQFKVGLWDESQEGLKKIFLQYNRLFTHGGWFILFEGFLYFFAYITIYRNRSLLDKSERWQFLPARPIAASLFLISLPALYFFEYKGAPAVWKLTNTAIAGIALARLTGALTKVSWQKQFVYGVMIVLISNKLMNIIGFAPPLLRLYTALVAMAGLFLCLWWIGKNDRLTEVFFHKWLLRSMSLFFLVIMLVEFWGKDLLPFNLLKSTIDSIATVLVVMMLLYIIHGILEWFFQNSPLRLSSVLQKENTATFIHGFSRFVDAIICGLILLPSILVIWGVYSDQEEATKSIFKLGFDWGSHRISLDLLIVSACILYSSFLLSWVLQKLLMDGILIKHRTEMGVRHSIMRLVHYAITFIGFLFALTALGIDITKFTIMLSALSVGIGFGLQGVVNNFISGLLLLFEQPVRVGDYIEFDGTWAEVKRIGLRATTVQTFDSADIIIPNADLVSNKVTNWTLNNRRVRLTIPVGVAYGSDVPLVIKTLRACSESNILLANIPAPQVLFLRFGESSLDFELRVWVLNADERMNVSSALHQEIEQRFRDEKIEIAFPQRDLHVRSLDKPVNLQPSEKTP